MTNKDLMHSLAGVTAGNLMRPPTKKDREHAEYMTARLIFVIGEALRKGEEVKIAGLGIFKVKATKERTGRNPKTGQAVQIPAGRKVSFSVSKELKTRVGGGE